MTGKISEASKKGKRIEKELIIVMLVKAQWLFFSVGDPDTDPHVFGPPSIDRGTDPDPFLSSRRC